MFTKFLCSPHFKMIKTEKSDLALLTGHLIQKASRMAFLASHVLTTIIEPTLADTRLIPCFFVVSVVALFLKETIEIFLKKCQTSFYTAVNK